MASLVTTTVSRAQTTAPFTTPFLKLIPSSTTSTTGLTSITLGTSTLDNYGYSISGWRAESNGNPYLKIMRHFNSAAGVDVMVMDAQGNVGIGITNPTEKLVVTGNAIFRHDSNSPAGYATGTDLAVFGSHNGTGTLFEIFTQGDISRFKILGSGATTVNGALTGTSATFSENSTLNGLRVGEWQGGSSYKGIFHQNHTANEYCLISNDGPTYISATTGQPVYIRGGNNVSTYQVVVSHNAKATASGYEILTTNTGLELSGGTLTGALTGTSATFSGTVTSAGLTMSSSTQYLRWPNTSVQASSRSWGFIGEQGLLGSLHLYRSDASDSTLDTEVLRFTNDGSATFYGTLTGTSATFNIASNGTLIDLQVGSASKGNIKTVDNDVVIHTTESAHSGLRLGNGYVAPTDNSGAVTNNTILLGLSNYRWENIYSVLGNFTGALTGTTATFSGLVTSVGGVVNTNTGSNPLYITRSGGTDQALKIYADDAGAIFESVQDESADNYGTFIFAMDSGTTEPFFDVRKGTASSGSKFRVDGSGSLQVGSSNTTFLDASRNLKNIGTISSGAITATADTDALFVKSVTNANAAEIAFSSQVPSYAQVGRISYQHGDGSSYGGTDVFTIGSTESAPRVLADGLLMFKSGLALKPATGTGAGTTLITSGRALQNITTISTSGSVGIGTASPQSLLHLYSTAPILSFTDSNSFSDANDRFIVRAGGTDGGYFQWYDSTTSNTTSLMTLRGATGRIGIGTTAPATKLTIESDTTGESISDGLRLQNSHGVNNDISPIYFGVHGGTRRAKCGIGWKRTGSYGIGKLLFALDNTGDDADVSFANDTKVTFQGDGNVGIGTSSPGALLDLETAGNTADGTYYSTVTINNTGSSTWSRLRFDRGGVAKWGLSLGTDDKFRISNLYTSGSTANPDDNTLVISNDSSISLSGALTGTSATFNIASNGTLIDLQVGSASKGNIKTVDNDVVIHTTESAHSGLRLGNGYVAPTDNSGAVTNNTIDLGLSTYRWENIYSVLGNFTGALTGTSATFSGAVSVGQSAVPQGSNQLEVNGLARVKGSLVVGTASANQTAGQALHIKGSGTQGLRIEDSASSNYVYDLTADFTNGFKITDVTSSVDVLTVSKTTGNTKIHNNLGIGADPTSGYQQYTVTTGAGIGAFSSSHSSYGRLVIATTAANADAQLSFMSEGSTKWSLGNNAGDTDKFQISPTGGNFGASVKFTLDASGNCGIGTTAPSGLLELQGSSGSTALKIMAPSAQNSFIKLGATGVTNSAYIEFRNDLADSLLFKENGVSTMILRGGNVGIGITAPEAPLHVGDGTNSNNFITAQSSAGNYCGIKLARGNGGFSSDSHNNFGLLVTDYGISISKFTSPGANATGRADYLTVKDGGNVGIGTTAPSAKLHVYEETANTTTASNIVRIQSHSSGTTGVGFGGAVYFLGERSGGDIQGMAKISAIAEVNSVTDLSSALTFQTATSGTNTEKVRITYDGNVGIGTSSPDHELQVKGDISIDNESSSVPSMLHFNASNKANLDPTSRICFWEGDGHAGTYTDSHAFIEYNGSAASGGDGYLALGGYTDAGANQDIMILNRLGRVGIGTDAPLGHLDINTERAEATKVWINGESNQDKLLYIRHYANSEAAGGTAYAGYIGSKVDNVLTLGHVNSSGTDVQVLHLTEAGLVGIGTSAPGNFHSAGSRLVIGNGVSNQGITLYAASDAASQINFADGSSGNASYRGIVSYDHSADKMNISTAATIRMSIDSSGKVGIGTSSPESLLTLQNDDATIRIRSNTTTTKGVTLRYNHSGSFGELRCDQQGVNQLDMKYYSLSHKFGRNDSLQYLTIDSAGHVGIGTTNPSDGDLTLNTPKLHVQGSTNSGAFHLVQRLQAGSDSNDTGAALLINHANDRGLLIEAGRGGAGAEPDDQAIMHLGLVNSAGTNARFMTARQGGNVGIGTDSPGAKLHVNGQAIIDSLHFDSLASHFIKNDGNLLRIAGDDGIKFQSYSSGWQTRMTIVDDGKVGIGTDSPSGVLHVRGDSGGDPYSTLFVESTTNHGGIVIDAENSTQAHVRFMSNGALKWQMRSPFQTGTNPDSLRFYSWVHGADVMTLTNDGKVGIGDVTPSYLLDVNGTGRFTGQLTLGTGIIHGSTTILNSSRELINIAELAINAAAAGSNKLYCNGNANINGDCDASTFTGSGASLTSLNGSNISSGTVAAARLGSGSSITSKFLRGDNTWQTVSSGSGDITGVTAGTTLSGGGTSGSVTINHANHTGEVTGSGSLTIAGNVVDEANLKVSNSPTNGYVLTARSGNTGGMTWEAASGGGGDTVSITTSADDILSVSSGAISGVDAGSSDKIVFWDNSQNKLTYLAASTGLYTSGTNLKVTSAVLMSIQDTNYNYCTPSSNTAGFYQGGSITVVASGNGVTFSDSTSSDYRLKSNISTFNSEAWTKVKSVNLRRFDFDESLIDPNSSSIIDTVGFIAHELAEAGIEGAVEGAKDEVDSDGNPVYQKVCLVKLVPVMWGALKEAITKIETLETKVQTLENS